MTNISVKSQEKAHVFGSIFPSSSWVWRTALLQRPRKHTSGISKGLGETENNWAHALAFFSKHHTSSSPRCSVVSSSHWASGGLFWHWRKNKDRTIECYWRKTGRKGRSSPDWKSPWWKSANSSITRRRWTRAYPTQTLAGGEDEWVRNRTHKRNGE